MRQIAAGIVAFAPVLTEGLDAFRQVLLTHQVDVEEEEDVEAEESSHGDGDPDEDTVELTEDDVSEMAAESASGNVVLDALVNVGPAPPFTVLPEEIKQGVTCWKFPDEASQGCYKGRNGSNACSLISLLIGYNFTLRKISPPECNRNISGQIVDVLCGCIEIGNRIYDLCRHSLPSRYLSIQEAASVLEMWFEIDVGDNLPVRLEDQHQLSTIGGQLQEAIASRTSFVAFIILNDKTSLFFFNEGVVMYIDTHSHDFSGAVVVAAKVHGLDSFCKAVWELEGNDNRTYGNFVIVTF